MHSYIKNYSPYNTAAWNKKNLNCVNTQSTHMYTRVYIKHDTLQIRRVRIIHLSYVLMWIALCKNIKTNL